MPRKIKTNFVTNPYFKTRLQKEVDLKVHKEALHIMPKITHKKSTSFSVKNTCRNGLHNIVSNKDGEGREFFNCSYCGNMIVRMPIFSQQINMISNKPPG